MPLFTNGFIPRSLASISLAMGDPPKTYSAMFTPSAPAKRIQFNRSFIETYRTTEDSTNHFPHLLPPATKLRQGNVFTPVGQSFCSPGGMGGLCPSMHYRSHDWGLCSGDLCLEGLCPGDLSGGSLSGGVCAGSLCPGGVLCPGGLCPEGVCPGRVSVQGGSVQWVSVQGGSLSGQPPWRETPLDGNKRVVRILLACILLKPIITRHLTFCSHRVPIFYPPRNSLSFPFILKYFCYFPVFFTSPVLFL